VFDNTRPDKESAFWARLDQAAIFQGEICLNHGRRANSMLGTGAPDARNALTRTERAGFDVTLNGAGNFLV
jgi:hypothetical protein